MILNALRDYYQRKTALGELAPEGYEFRNIPFVIVLSKEGKFVQLIGTRVTKDEAAAGKNDKLYLIPKGVSRTGKAAYKNPNCLWDSEGYVLGVAVHGEKDSESKKANDQEKADNQHAYFCRLVDDLIAETGDEELMPVQAFLGSQEEKAKVQTCPEWADVLKAASKNLTFKIVGENHLVCQSKAAKHWVEKNLRIAAAETDLKGQCLLTGEYQPIVRLHPAFKGVKGANATGGAIVSFNSSPTSSYGLDKGENAPVSHRAAMEYGEALNHLLRQNSPNKFTMLDLTMVCWAEKSSPLESMIPLNFAFSSKDNPDAGIDAVKNAVNTIRQQGAGSSEGSQKFYLLGLKGANGRVAIQYWKQTTVFEMGQALREWLDDVTLPHAEKGIHTPALYSLFSAIALKGEMKTLPPNIPPSLIRAILDRQRMPGSILKALMLRIRAERQITPTRASMLKAYLNREARFKNEPEKEIGMAFDLEGKPIGYRLGALFANFEKIQDEASEKRVSASVRDRYYNSFSARPMSVLGTLDRLSKSHLSVLQKKKPGLYFGLQKRLGSLMASLDVDTIPKSLNTEQQSYFAIGYYQQREDIFLKKTTKKTEDTPKGEVA